MTARARKAKIAAPANWPANNIETWPLDKLKPFERNPRTHSDQQIAQLAASIKRWGWTIPVLIDEEGMILAGHGRVLAGRLLELAECPVIVARGWTDARKRAYVIADNKLALNAGWDDELLKMEMNALRDDLSYNDLAAIGFSDRELANMLSPGDADADAAAQLDDGLSYSIVIRCKNESDQLEWLQRLQGEGVKCEALIA